MRKIGCLIRDYDYLTRSSLGEHLELMKKQSPSHDDTSSPHSKHVFLWRSLPQLNPAFVEEIESPKNS